MQIKLSPRELATVLAALRYWQEELEPDGIPPIMDYFTDGTEPLSIEDIDELCERLNCKNPHA